MPGMRRQLSTMKDRLIGRNALHRYTKPTTGYRAPFWAAVHTDHHPAAIVKRSFEDIDPRIDAWLRLTEPASLTPHVFACTFDV